MNVDQKLTTIRDVIQQDIGNRGLARDPEKNLVNAFPLDFAHACLSIADHPKPSVGVLTGFMIPTVVPPLPETDGPLGAVYLRRAFDALGTRTTAFIDWALWQCFALSQGSIGVDWESSAVVLATEVRWALVEPQVEQRVGETAFRSPLTELTHLISIERVGPNHTLESLRSHPATTDAVVASFAANVPTDHRDRCYTMRGRDITKLMFPAHSLLDRDRGAQDLTTIGIGDGGNEIGMGKIPHETIVKNIPNGDLIHCRVATDHLIVAGVSNWGAYALAAGVALLRGVELPAELFDPDREREILQVMVDAGPLVDGVTGKQEATVDGLSWDDYIRPLVEIGKIVKD